MRLKAEGGGVLGQRTPAMSPTGLPTAMPTHSYDNSVLFRVGTRFWWPNQLMLADHVEATHDLVPLAWCCLVAGALILLHDLHLNRLRYSLVRGIVAYETPHYRSRPLLRQEALRLPHRLRSELMVNISY